LNIKWELIPCIQHSIYPESNFCFWLTVISQNIGFLLISLKIVMKDVILITGCAGFIGFHLAQKFMKKGLFVVGVDNVNDYYDTSLKYARLDKLGWNQSKIDQNSDNTLFRFFGDDINSTTLEKELKKYNVTCVFHLAAQAGVRYSFENPKEYVYANILGYHSILEIVRNLGVKLMFYASSSSVYGSRDLNSFSESEVCAEPQSVYAASKLYNEHVSRILCSTYGVSLVGLRFFTVYGPYGRPDMAPMLFADAIFNERELKIFNYGKQYRDFTSVYDIVEAIYLLWLHFREINEPNFDIINIGRGEPISLMDFILAIEKFTGKEARKIFMPKQMGDVENTFCNNEKLKMLTGFSPTVSLESGIEDFMNWFQSYKTLAI
jgi:UDP-glucuronate 4-epimerase